MNHGSDENENQRPLNSRPLSRGAGASFDDYVLRLRALERDQRRGKEREKAVTAALDGEARRTAREVIPSAMLKALGAFFTRSSLRAQAWSLFREPLQEGSVVLDPAVGAGDLLLGAFDHLPDGVSAELRGFDLHEGFLAAARARLSIATTLRSAEGKRGLVATKLRKGSGLVQHRAIAQATHIIMNPPFTAMTAPARCTWAHGRVNSAAVFLDAVIGHASPGTEVLAIVPDVLRSGSRYSRWRTDVAARAHVLKVVQVGRFDEWTDVDVILLHLRRREGSTSDEGQDWGSLVGLISGSRVDSVFDISVGAVVDYRSPKRGPWQPYLIARDAPRWGRIDKVTRRRRFRGTVVPPPFVVVRRTSSPSDRQRAVATIVDCAEHIAIENHLLVARPKDGSVDTCARLLERLNSTSATSWFNDVIACRHLTVTALGGLPW